MLATATASGFVAAIVVSICATLAYNYYFLPPIGQFTIADPENWVALFTIVLTSLVASHLSHRAQKDAAEAKRSQQETERLYAFSRAILLNDATRSIGPQAAQSIAQIFDAPPPPSSTENRTPSIVADPSKSRPESPIPKPAFMSRPARRAL